MWITLYKASKVNGLVELICFTQHMDNVYCNALYIVDIGLKDFL
jgi:hypothetical protein